ncbi:quinone-dependent dihydroorotate dehydrogenase [Corynebacterium uberis]|uniref:quinone-dependent dihydroorotate dehydrogenase n=1 Tax=Corynebacterium TaxID=1716 RepID=UPI001D0BA50B|nr:MULTISPECIES: quinone-dependent dihydroorotate dehydrogenase [Corynebacterium]MCZ9308643.1 quinone-dependent dihydroorotate dehydrogenase [Corynebacterium sp. c6VSa_13]UDL76882.1 quinone-dependent dihydroorotate dehydrogenase [Corynebacterium uberis]UDL79095.1 quinone-dependent dihydroorotate dehydrogenase [Corynebacterium uberis]UDL79333.1 quinone-dependent dihydroorotate dehydrogenase [Corynebacterium uberis]UDL83509.1 quinone-dependent dihydroorotate dehydrogenase [Corynebacterium uberis
MGSLRQSAYQLALKAMFRIDPERIHGMINDALGLCQFFGPVNRMMGHIFPVKDDILTHTVFGVEFPRPLGLAAGFDKAANSPDVWTPLGFGYAEVGTVTASPQPGNPQPRLFRLKKDRGILNRMGFNNPGAAQVASNMARRHSRDVVGINIGKTKVVPLEDAVADYRRSASLLEYHASFLVVNVSSPNTPGLRDLQAVESLRPILQAVQGETTKPVLVKIAPDLSDADIDAVADLAVELGLAGIVATNTTISREGLATNAAAVADMGAGGVSGPPVAARSLEVLHRLYGRVGGKLALVSVGGIETAEQAWERIAAGADLLQGYTALIYYGPDWIRDIHRGLADQLRAQGMSNIKEAVGCGRPWIAS